MLPPKTRLELCREFHVSSKTFRKMLLEHDLVLPPGLVHASYQKLIYETLGYPNEAFRSALEKVKLPAGYAA